MTLAALQEGQPTEKALFGHPVGLTFLVLAEAWERFSYFGMQTLLVLFMVEEVLLPGHIEHILGIENLRTLAEHAYGPLSTTAFASAIFGLFAGAVYLTPILGGLIADRWLGHTRTIILGGVTLACGQFLLSFDASFLVALVCLALGVGCYKGNIASQVGGLYRAGDVRRANGFQILFLGMCIAVVITQVICGSIAERFGWHWGFLTAGGGMLVGLSVYLAGRRTLPKSGIAGTQSGRKPPLALSRQDWQILMVLFLLLCLLMVGLIGNQQYYNAFLVWAKTHVDLVFFGHDLPVTWLAGFDSFMAIVAALLSIQFWQMLAKRQIAPSEIVKLTLGVSMQAAALLVLAAASFVASESGKIGFGWIFCFESLLGLGGANITPIILALVARVAPRQINATMISASYLMYFGASMLVGWLGGFVERMDSVSFWLMHAALIQGAALCIFVVGRVFRPLLANRAADPV